MASAGRLLASHPSTGGPKAGSGSAGGGSSNPGPSDPRKPRQRRTLTESACAACRRRKSKCDGVRPRCSRCQTLGSECVYEANQGESRWSALKRRNKTAEAERDDLGEIIAQMRSRPEDEALEIFRRVRSSSYEELLATTRHLRQTSTAATPTQLPDPGAYPQPTEMSRPPPPHPASQPPAPVHPSPSRQSLPPIQSLLNSQFDRIPDPSRSRRLESVSSDGDHSSGSHSSNFSGSGMSTSQAG